VWEPERAYEKRLTAIMAKDNPQVPKVKKPRKGAKSGAAAASSAEESEGEKTLDEDEAAPRPKPKRATRANPVVEEGAALDEGNEADPVTPKARPRPRPIHRDKTPTGSLHGGENGQQKSFSGSPLPPVGPPDGEQGLGEPNNETATPQSSSLKRPRTADDEEAGLGEPNNEIATPKSSSLKRPRTADDEEALEAAPNGTSAPDHLINVDGTPDMQIRRKRIRH